METLGQFHQESKHADMGIFGAKTAWTEYTALNTKHMVAGD